MKTRQKSFRNLLMASGLAMLSSFAFVACDKDDDDVTPNNQSYTISGNASGLQVVPSVTGSGRGTITGTYNPNTKQFIYSTTWDSLSGNPTSAAFYNGASGATGVMVGEGWTFDSTAIVNRVLTDTLMLTDEQASQLTSGNWYYSYGTVTNPNGEIRGQISATR